MNKQKDKICIFSDPGLAVKCILLISFFIFSCMLLSFLAYSEFKEHHYVVSAGLILFAFISILSCTIYIARDLSNSLVHITITCNEIQCVLFNDHIKTLAWNDVLYISKVQYIYGTTSGPHIREYCVFSKHDLSEKERQGAIMYATTQNDMIVMLYRKRLLEQIRVLVGNCIPNELVDETNVFK